MLDNIDRRTFLMTMASFATISHPSRADTPKDDLTLVSFTVRDESRYGYRAAVLVPTVSPKTSPDSRWPVLVLLHGLGETGSERDGAFAWAERYGLLSSYGRLLRPPVQAERSRYNYLRRDRAESIDRSLDAFPFNGMILVCPYTPNVFQMPTVRALDNYAKWIVESLLPEVRSKTPAKEGARWTGIDGVSLGGYVSFHVFHRRPEAFFTCGGVQAAIGERDASMHAGKFHDAVERHGPRRFHVETSSLDPYKTANVELSRRMKLLGVDHELSVHPGHHNQPWLVEIGTLDMLLWHDRQLSEGVL